jgi:hypothetical protein
MYKALITQVDRGRRNFCIQKVKETKNDAWKQDIWELIDMSGETNTVPDVELPEYTPLKPKKEAPFSKVEHWDNILLIDRIRTNARSRFGLSRSNQQFWRSKPIGRSRS